MSDNKKTLAEKAATVAAVAAGVVAAAAVIPQDELMKKGIPGIWESIKGIAELNWLRLEEAAKKFRPVAFGWVEKLWSFMKLWLLLAATLIAAGIMVKTAGSNFGHVLVAAGTVLIAGLGLTLYTLSDGLAVIAYVGLKTCGSLIGKTTSIVGVDLPDVIDAEGLAKFREKVRLLLAGTVVMSFSLLFTMFFPAWSTLGWTLIFWAMVSVAVVAAIHLDMKMGKAVRVVFFITLAMIVGTFVLFIIDRLTGGALGFTGFRNWLLRLNGSEIFVFLLTLVPAILLLVSAFAKDKDKKASFRQSAKYVGIGAAVLGVFLLYKGTISWKQLAGKEPPAVLTKTADKAESAYLNALEGESKSGTATAPQGSSSNGDLYMSPPTGSYQPQNDSDPTARTPKLRAKKPPLPRLKAKKYDDAATAVDDLESLL